MRKITWYMSYVLHAYFLTLKIHNNVFSPLILSRCQDVILSFAIKTVIRSVVTCIMHLTVVCILVRIKLFSRFWRNHPPHMKAMVIFIEIFFFFEKLNNQKQKNKKTKTQNVIFPAPPILNIFAWKFQGLVLGWVE